MSGFHWLASYPKSGNTWLRLALSSLKQDGAPPDFAGDDDFSPIASDRSAFDLLLDVVSSDMTHDEVTRLRPRFYEIDAGRRDEPQVRKVHDAWTCTSSGEPLFPPSLTRAAIYIVRDPRDVAVSLSHHIGSGIDDAIAFMDRDTRMATKRGGPQLGQRLLTWGGHVRSWMDAPVTPLLVRYEDMLAAPDAALRRAALHFGWTIPDDAAVARAVEATRFDVLKAAEEAHGFRERSSPAQRFFRRGVAGGWREILTPAQVTCIEEAHGAVMRDLGYLAR